VNGVDRFIRDLRIAQVVRRVRPGSRVLDIGCHDGALFRAIGPALREGVGIDPDLVGPLEGPNYRLAPGRFPEDLPEAAAPFDAVCALAVLEHVEGRHDQHRFAEAVAEALLPGGQVLLTVPSPRVDQILDIMMALKLLDGMETDAHHGFDVEQVVPLFESVGLELVTHQQFQLGLNNLFEFRRPAPTDQR
jgi:2-polyprenyl-3-methyl-5-hydroxy-6-metoxy-1,4-benzoquinol methylase